MVAYKAAWRLKEEQRKQGRVHFARACQKAVPVGITTVRAKVSG